MMTEVKEARDSQLSPDRYPQHELFICDVADAVFKDVMQQMEHPFYSLSKKPSTEIRRYEHNGNWFEVTPSVKGLATIYDKDILIYCISQLMAAKKRGETINKRRVRINSRDLLVFTNRGTAGKDYKALIEAIDRLGGTRISTNIRTGDEEQYDTFGLIETGSIRRKHGLNGRLLWCEVVLSDWVFNAINAQEVLTLHRDYFRLKKPIERRIYELARKHCGSQNQFICSLSTLHKKSGSLSTLREFRRAVKHLAEHDHLPDYSVRFGEEKDQVIFVSRGSVKAFNPQMESEGFPLRPETYEAAKEACPGWDIYHVEREWRAWIKKPPINPDAAFIGFCAKWYAKRGPAR